MNNEQLQLLRAALASRYRIERELGHGGMATVYLALDVKHDRHVALKVMRPDLAAVLGSERFLREIQVAARLEHPNIVTLYDSGDAGGTLYYTMTYVKGESLRDRMVREGPLPLAVACRIAGDVAQALTHAHAHDVVHRDIKPENILLDGDRAMVADFGIARAVAQAAGDRLTQTGIAVGTPVYMSPEQAAAESRIDGRSDIYSLACVVYEMLAGHPPFTGATAQELRARHSMDAVPSLRAARPNMPDGVEAAISTALQKSPADRFATANQFAAALSGTGANALRGGVSSARRILTGAAAAAVIVAVAVGAALLVRKHAREGEESSRVVVMPFENRTTLTELDPLGTVVAEWVTQGLTEAPFLTVLDTHGAQATAEKVGAGATPVDIGRETGAGVVVAGSYVLQGDSLQFQARITSTTDGRILVGVSDITTPRDRPMAGVERLQQRLMAGFASLHDRDLSTFQTALARPPTYRAYHAYVEGVESYIGGGGLESAERFLQAAKLDSTFLTPRIWAAQAGIMGGWAALDDGWVRRADSLLSSLRPLTAHLTPFDRARLDFVTALRLGDSFGAYEASLRLVDAAPGSVDARREAAQAASRVLRPREALHSYEALDPTRGLMRGWAGDYWGAVSGQHHRLGEYEEELRAVRRARQFEPSALLYVYVELRALAALGRMAELDSIAQIEQPHNSSQRDLFVFGVAGELMAHGHADAARRLARHALDHPAAVPPSEPVAARDWLTEQMWMRRVITIPYCYLGERVETRRLPTRALDEWLHGRIELALLLGEVRMAADLAAQLRDPGAHGLLLARVLAADGQLVGARAFLDRWEGRMLQARGTLNGLELERASFHVRLGDRERALAVLSEGIGLRPLPNSTNSWDGHAYPEFAPLFSDPRFRALIKPRG